MNTNTIADRLRFEIAHSGWSINATARRTGIDVGHLWRFVHGKVGISLSNAQVLADLFGLVLVRRDDRQKPKTKTAKTH